MPSRKRKKKKKIETAADFGGSAVLLAARLQTGAGKHRNRPTRQASKAAALREQLSS